ncbi:hypothetical protein AAHA92_32977 [Salvia divinorum]|uniref:Uncharacterized protein n=1 Tax=Salvia divinorum TaxID=28513 RepID=A0ABD1FQ26_SALDI
MDVDFWAASTGGLGGEGATAPSIPRALLRLEKCSLPNMSANLGRDAIGHFAAQHAHSIKVWLRFLARSGFWSNASSNIIRELRELSSFLGSNSPNNSGNSGNEPCHDPLAPFLCIVPITVKDIQKEQPCVASTSDEERKADSCRPSTIFVRTLLPLPIPEALDDASLFNS